MFASEKEGHSIRLLLEALAVVVVVIVVLALPFALVEAGLKAKKAILLTYLVILTILFAYMLKFWIIRYSQTSHLIKMLREEMELHRPLLENPETPRTRQVNKKEREK